MAANPNSIVTVGKARFGNNLPLALIAGPCALESRAHAFDMAAALKRLLQQHCSCGVRLTRIPLRLKSTKSRRTM